MKLLKVSLVIIGLIICIVGTAFLAFRVRTVTSDISISRNVLNVFLNTNLVFTNYNKKIMSISKMYPEIASIAIEKKYPSEIALTIKKSQGTLAVYDREKYIIVNKQGVIMKISDNSDGLQILTYFREIPDFSRKKGNMIPFEDIHYVLRLQEECSSNKYAQARSILVPSPTLLELHFAQVPIFTISTQKSVAKNAFLVHNMQQVVREKNIQATAVDLRYGLPVIKK
ncbi:MAG: hypothetical protein NUV65_05450 [Candidatus Roizmanbacteria bacterium]|nr:hypothetical protein [Candidatus Roizmanbacteria bacterium]